MLDFEISPADAASLLKEGKARFIDVREPWEFSTAKIDGTTLIPMGDVTALAYQELDPDERLVILCHHAARSLNTTVWLRSQAFGHANSTRGGIDAWFAEIDSNVPR